jgi:hypothetical protein
MSLSTSAGLFRVLAGILVLVTQFAAAPRRERLDDSIPAFSDGEWTGVFSMVTSSTTDVTDIVTSYKGNLGFLSAGGTLDGEWTMNGTSNYAGDITGFAKFEAGGKVAGTSYALQFVTSKFTAHMELVVAGMPTSQDVDLGKGAGMELLLKSATCSQATADIEAVTASNLQSAGMPSDVNGSFTAVRVKDLSAANQVDYMIEVGDIIEQAEAYKQKIKDGQTTSFIELNKLVSKADSLNMAIHKNIECGLGGKKQFLTMITDVVAGIASLALDNPHLFTTDQLNRLLFVAVHVGAVGSGAVNSQQAAELESKFIKELTDRLNDAQSNNNCYDALVIQISAGTLGNAGLKQQAADLVNSMC